VPEDLGAARARLCEGAVEVAAQRADDAGSGSKIAGGKEAATLRRLLSDPRHGRRGYRRARPSSRDDDLMRTTVSRRLGAALAQRRVLRRAGERLIGLDAALAARLGAPSRDLLLQSSSPCDAPDPGTSDLDIARTPVPPTVAPFLSFFAPGHFYSPVPDLAEIGPRADRLFSTTRELPGIDLRVAAQLELFGTLAALARESPLPAVPGTAGRYGVANPNYGVGDASMLQAMLRHLRPAQYLEVGSGYTTALALDTNERFLGGEMSLTAIEPHPEVLRAVLRPGDRVEIIAEPVQSVPLERFQRLGAGDVLFVDCSHVLKTGSDVQHLYTNVLPVLAPGVCVHVHDIFWPFEYLRHWVEAGRAWNEVYLLHAFLLFNGAFEILLWNHYLALEHRDRIEAELPVMLATPGGAIWLRRTGGA
jgi:hypothetical protein